MLSILDDVSANNVTIIDKAIGHPTKIVILVRGDHPGAGGFVDRAGRAANEPWRDVLWLKDEALVDASTASAVFAGTSAAAVVLDFDDNVSAELPLDASFFEIRQAIFAAEQA